MKFTTSLFAIFFTFAMTGAAASTQVKQRRLPGAMGQMKTTEPSVNPSPTPSPSTKSVSSPTATPSALPSTTTPPTAKPSVSSIPSQQPAKVSPKDSSSTSPFSSPTATSSTSSEPSATAMPSTMPSTVKKSLTSTIRNDSDGASEEVIISSLLSEPPSLVPSQSPQPSVFPSASPPPSVSMKPSVSAKPSSMPACIVKGSKKSKDPKRALDDKGGKKCEEETDLTTTITSETSSLSASLKIESSDAPRALIGTLTLTGMAMAALAWM